MTYAITHSPGRNAEANKLCAEDEAFHAWYRFVLSYPPHLVRHYLERFGVEPGQCVLDPFCGTGTTLVTCKQLGIRSVGAEGTPMGRFATSVKVDWSPDPEALLHDARGLVEAAARSTREHGNLPLLALSPDAEKTLLRGSISPRPLHRALKLREAIDSSSTPYSNHALLALAKVLPTRIGNLRFGPEVGVAVAKQDAPVLDLWLGEIATMAADLAQQGDGAPAAAAVHLADSRDLRPVLEPRSIDAVITSPPYPNEKDYTRIMRLEMAVLGLVRSPKELQALKRTLLCSNTRTVYRANDDDRWVADNRQIADLAARIEARRCELGKTSGFERQYHRVVTLYFGGMYRHLANLRPLLRPGAQLAYVVGDQASYLQVMIRTGQVLAALAESLGYETVGIDLFRTRLATATKEQLREEAVILRWPGQ